MAVNGIAVGSVARVIGLRHAEEARRRKRLASLRTWWILTIVLCGGLLAGVAGVCLLLIAASCIAWREYTAMLGVRSHDQLAIRAGYGFVLPEGADEPSMRLETTSPWCRPAPST